jgi:F-type H+-transporting ATPase subunit b
MAALLLTTLCGFYPALIAAESLWRNEDLWKVINLLVFVLILAYLLRNKVQIGRVFDNRAASIAKDLEQARREKQSAEDKLAQVAARLAKLDEEIVRIRAQAEQEAAREAERIQQAAAADAEKIKQQARREIEGGMKAARAELRAFVAEHSVGMAEGIIRREIQPEDNKRLISEYIDELTEVNR